jgi:hypothetical protein
MLEAMLDVPRSLRLAAWGSAVLAGACPVPAMLNAVTGDDEPHVILAEDPAELPAGCSPGDGLAALVDAWRHAGVPALTLRLPVPGNVLGLPGPPAFNVTALEAGECVVTERSPSGEVWGAVPDVEQFGSAPEPGYLVTWSVRRVEGRAATDLASVSEADQALRLALARASDELAGLDVARWRQDAAALVAGVRDGGLERGTLPASTSPRAVRVIASALRLRAIVAVASQDDGSSVTSQEVQRRSRALHDLDDVARRALVAAVSCP